MKKSNSTRTIVVAAIVLLAGSTLAFAHGGWGNNDGYNGNMMGPGYGGYMMGPGYGGHMMGPGWGRGYGPGPGYANLSEEQRAKIDAARDKFFDETRTLRRSIDDKSYELRREMDKENPDAKKVGELQKDLSKLQADFDQKAVQHRIEMRKLVPEDARGYGRGYGRGYYGRGNCWQDND